jgi:hypothetical protein
MNNIQEILTAIEAASGIAPEAFNSANIQQLPSVSYTLYKQSDNAVIERWRLQTRVTAESLEEAMTTNEAIISALVTLGDEEKFGALRIEINGGGTLEEPETRLPQLLTYYDIQNKS